MNQCFFDLEINFDKITYSVFNFVKQTVFEILIRFCVVGYIDSIICSI